MQNVQKDNHLASPTQPTYDPSPPPLIEIFKKKKMDNRLSHQFDAYLTITFTFRTILTMIFG